MALTTQLAPACTKWHCLSTITIRSTRSIELLRFVLTARCGLMASSSSRLYSWEQRVPQFERHSSAKAAPSQGDGEPDNSDSEDCLPEDLTPNEAGEELIHYLLELHFSAKLSAKTLSVICFSLRKRVPAGPSPAMGSNPLPRPDTSNATWTAR